ncbi:virulence-associated E family protein [Paracoccaceae bacterium]|nr:virulence-associated E family protein [Paracoccaceae bacterium]
MSNNPNEMYATLQALPKNSAATQEQSEKNFSKKLSTKDWASRSQQDGKWNSSILQVTKNFVAEGKTDEAIHAVTDGLTTDGYSIEQTRKQVQPMIDGARAKFEDNTIRNTANVYAMLTENERWSSVFAFDELANREMIISKPPYDTGNPAHFKQRPIRDNDYTKVQMWIQRNWGNVNKQVVIDAVNAACDEQTISPIRHYLEGLGESELDISTVFESYFGVVPENDEHQAFIRAASSLFLKQAVARAINPGCKADTVIVLEGKQGTGKSTGLRVLFSSEWFKDSMPPMSSKDASDYIVGAWCIELAEMAFQGKAKIEQQKAFISRQEEKYRPAYKRNEIIYLRRCVFIATTNRDDWALDETGNRRFLPVKTTKIDVAGLKRDRDAIWAAAYAEYQRKPQWWLTDQHVLYAAQQTELRQESDIWVELIQQQLSGMSEVSIKEAFAKLLGLDCDLADPQKITQNDQRRMSKCLVAAG